MNDRRFFFQPVKKFSYPNPKKQCSDYLQELGVQLVVITYGCKIYITGGIIPLVQLITSHAYNQRCYFEVIPPETPVKLYFDIDHAGQVDVDAYKEFEELFIDTVVRRLETDHFYKDWDTNCKPLILKSNGTDKHSVHYIFPVVFDSTILMKSFVLDIIKELADDPFSKDIDAGVYTAWRNFRMVQNTKKGKMNHLVLQDSTQNAFQQTFQCFVSVMRNKKSYKSVHPDLDYLFNCKRVITPTKTTHDVKLTRSASSTLSGSCIIPDKYKELVQKIEEIEIEKKFPNHTYYRSFQQFNGYDFIDYIFCPGLPCPGNQGRAHKSNKTYFKIDINKGTVFYRCADPACSSDPFQVNPICKLVPNHMEIPSKVRGRDTAYIQGQSNHLTKKKKVGRG